jgi:hypothetical protein
MPGAKKFPYTFRPKRKTAREFNRVLQAVSARLVQLTRQRGGEAEAIHEMRTLIKLLRALLWFARPALPPTTSAYAKIELHNAARLLAARRDLTARQLVLECLQRKAGGEAERAAVKKAAEWVARQAPKIGDAAVRRRRLQASALVRKTIRLLVHSAATESRWKAPERRLKRARAASDRARQAAAQEPTPANLHEWRKKVKRLFLLLLVLPGTPRREIKAAEKLQRQLGDHHDAVLLEENLLKHHPAAEPALRPVLDLLEARKKKLRRKAERSPL